jgi:urease accessory protein UreH
VRYEGTLRASRGFPELQSTHVIVATIGPGQLGGDATAIEGRVGRRAHLVVHAQSATKVYGPGRSAARARWSVAAGATLEIRGRPLLLFAGAAYESHLEIDLEGDARVILTDYVAFVEDAPATARLSLTIRRDGAMLLRDALALDRAVVDGEALGTLVTSERLSSEDGSAERAMLRATAPAQVRLGVGSPLGGGLFVRARGPHVWQLETLFVSLLEEEGGIRNANRSGL